MSFLRVYASAKVDLSPTEKCAEEETEGNEAELGSLPLLSSSSLLLVCAAEASCGVRNGAEVGKEDEGVDSSWEEEQLVWHEAFVS